LRVGRSRRRLRRVPEDRRGVTHAVCSMSGGCLTAAASFLKGGQQVVLLCPFVFECEVLQRLFSVLLRVKTRWDGRTAPLHDNACGLARLLATPQGGAGYRRSTPAPASTHFKRCKTTWPFGVARGAWRGRSFMAFLLGAEN
jgi:hypothetical protein